MSTITKNTRLIETKTEKYPFFLPGLGALLNCSLPAQMNPDDIKTLGFEEVLETEPPEGDIVSEGVPEKRAGKWYRTWVIRSYSDEEINSTLVARKAELTTQAEALRVQEFERGFPHLFGEEIYHVQIRNADRANLTSMRIIAKEVLAASLEQEFPFRVYENICVTLTAVEMVALADAAFAATTEGYQASWAYKDAVKAATSIAELPALPVAIFTQLV